MTHPNETLLRRNYQAAAEGDFQTIVDRMADDIVWHVGGHNPLSGDYRGKDEVLGYLGRLGEETGGTLKNEPHDVLANDEHAVGLLQFSAQRGDKSLSERAAHIVHIRDGKVAEVWFFWEDQRVVDEFFS
jgi:uncharacterized protein